MGQVFADAKSSNLAFIIMFFPYFPLFITRQQSLNQRIITVPYSLGECALLILGVNEPKRMPMVV